MARRRRPGPRTSVGDGRAELVLPLEFLVDPDGAPMAWRDLRPHLKRLDEYPLTPGSAPSGVALVLDRFAFDLHVADVGHATDVHDGDDFLEAALAHPVAVFVVDGVDPRRSGPGDLDGAARDGRLVAGLVRAFQVDVLS